MSAELRSAEADDEPPARMPPRRSPLAMAAPLVAVFGLLHGQAHGAEAGSLELTYALGALVATAALHAAGLVLARPLARLLPRAQLA